MIKNLKITGGVAIIEKDKKYLLIKQSRTKPLGGQWRFPGGKYESKEDHLKGLIREVREETNLEIEILNNNPIDIEKNDYSPGYFEIYRTKYKSGRLKIAKKEIKKARWFSIREIKKLNLMPAIRVFFKKFSQTFTEDPKSLLK